MILKETVDHPVHYKKSGFEAIDIIEAFAFGFHIGNVVKYIFRYKYKGKPIEDLKKARWYLDRKIQLLEEAEAKEKKQWEQSD